MHCCGKLFRSLLQVASALLVSLSVLATEVDIRNPLLALGDDGYILTADFTVDFNPRLEEAVAKGVILYFVTDFELTRARWYWLDEKIASRTQTFRLSYHALTRQYRLSTGALHQSFDNLDEALRMLGRLRNWNVLEKTAVKPDDTYLASLRFRLDLSQMPKTFQVTALSNRDWNLASEWARWSFVPADGKTGYSESK
jgi:Domain of unknown function (DUF4390)